MACQYYPQWNAWFNEVGYACTPTPTERAMSNVATGSPSSGGYVNQLPTISTPGGTAGGAPIQSGGSWLNDLLNTLIYTTALTTGAGHVPTTAHVQQPQQVIYPQTQPSAIPSSGGSAGATFGDSIQQFVTNNTGLLLLLGIGFVLFKSGRK